MPFYGKRVSLLLIFLLLLTLFSSAGYATEIEKKEDEYGVAAKSYILLEAGSGYVIAKKNEHEKLHPASITKLMTILLTMDALQKGKIKLTDQVTASETAMSMGGTEIWLEPGEKMCVEELLMAATVGSANDACVALAEHISGSELTFVRMMNEKAQEIGMKDTVYKNSNGLPQEGHHTSAYDIALLGRYLISHYPAVLKYTSTKEHHLRGGKTWLVNTNHMLGVYQGLDGLKTGWTEEAGFCLAATAKREDLRLLAVVLGEQTPRARSEDVTNLLNYGFANYAIQKIVHQGEPVLQVPIHRGTKKKIGLLAKADLSAIVPAGEESKLSKEVFLTTKLEAPIGQGKEVGELRAKNKKGQIVGRVPVVTGEAIEKSGVLRNIYNFIGSLLFFWKK